MYVAMISNFSRKKTQFDIGFSYNSESLEVLPSIYTGLVGPVYHFLNSNGPFICLKHGVTEDLTRDSASTNIIRIY